MKQEQIAEKVQESLIKVTDVLVADVLKEGQAPQDRAVTVDSLVKFLSLVNG